MVKHHTIDERLAMHFAGTPLTPPSRQEAAVNRLEAVVSTFPDKLTVGRMLETFTAVELANLALELAHRIQDGQQKRLQFEAAEYIQITEGDLN